MTVVSTVKDLDAKTFTITASFTATPDRVWQLWEDPRQLERWWGPPEWPATFTAYDPVVGGTASYHMTGPDGTKVHGWWRFLTITQPAAIAFEDWFADDNGKPDPAMPFTHAAVAIVADGDVTSMTIISTFASLEALETVMAMGMEEGITAALGQIDGILAEG